MKKITEWLLKHKIGTVAYIVYFLIILCLAIAEGGYFGINAFIICNFIIPLSIYLIFLVFQKFKKKKKKLPNQEKDDKTMAKK